MNVLVTGASGQLGRDVVEVFESHGFEVFGFTRSELDITDEGAVHRLINKIHPDVIIHAAAYTNVNQAEDDVEQAYNVNVVGTRNVTLAAEKVGAKICYISTDYVFDGLKNSPYTESDLPNPINVYGKSKYEGEMFVRKCSSKYFIVRTSWVFGVNGKNFVKTMLHLAKKGDDIRVVDDQIGTPTYSEDLARFLAELVITDKYGTYHASNTGSCSWYQFAKTIFEFAGKNVLVHPIPSSQFPSKARRPSYSVLAHEAILENGFNLLPEWEDGLKRFLTKYKRVDPDGI